MNPDTRLITLLEVSELTRVPLATLRTLRQRGAGPRLFKLAGRLVAEEADVLDWIRQAKAREVQHPVPSGALHGPSDTRRQAGSRRPRVGIETSSAPRAAATAPEGDDPVTNSASGHKE